MEHYSQRLKRNFEDGDWLVSQEAAAVIAQNSGRASVKTSQIADLARLGILKADKTSGTWQYEYAKIKDYCIRRGRHPQRNPSKNAIRQRAFKERQRALAEQQ